MTFSMLVNLKRCYYLLRYHKLHQLTGRIRAVLRRRWRARFGVQGYSKKFSLEPRPQVDDALREILKHKLAERRDRGATERAKKIRGKKLFLLNEEVDFSAGIDWHLDAHPQLDALWKFHLHYQEYLFDLAVSAEDGGESGQDDYSIAWELVNDWIQANPSTDKCVFGAAWHPFCISRRLPVWILLWTAQQPPEHLQAIVLSSIANQANFLADNLELDLGGNHLLENLNALGFAGSFLNGPDAGRWLQVVDRHLSRELPEQLTAHGEHFERSPMYHSFMLEVMLNLRDATRTVHSELSQHAAAAAEKMANFIQVVLHPDQEIPLLSDSAMGQAPPPSILLSRAGISPSEDTERTPTEATPLSGYWTYRDQDHFLIFDAEQGFPNHLPAHGHADLLNLEASLFGQRVFVDSGVHSYAAGTMRQYCRSSAAHNVLEVDGQDQIDMWSRFRVGYRGWPTELETGQTGEFHWARSTHNAYRRLGVPSVGRWLACRAGGPWLCLDWAVGNGEHELVQRLHLHPSVQVSQVEESIFQFQVGEHIFSLQALGCLSAGVEQGWYCEEFGTKVHNPVITLRGRLPSTPALGWALCWPGQEGQADLGSVDHDKAVITWEGLESLQLEVALHSK